MRVYTCVHTVIYVWQRCVVYNFVLKYCAYEIHMCTSRQPGNDLCVHYLQYAATNALRYSKRRNFTIILHTNCRIIVESRSSPCFTA